MNAMNDAARHAIHAAKNRRSWGIAACVRYCQKRHVPLSLFTLARILEAARRHGV